MREWFLVVYLMGALTCGVTVGKEAGWWTGFLAGLSWPLLAGFVAGENFNARTSGPR